MKEKPTEEELMRLREYEEREHMPYVPRPRWQIIFAWVLLAIVVAGIVNLCYWQIVG